MARVETTLKQGVTPMPKVDQLLELAPPETPAAMGYLASFAMTALAAFCLSIASVVNRVSA